MSSLSDSDSDLFYDAVDATPLRGLTNYQDDVGEDLQYSGVTREQPNTSEDVCHENIFSKEESSRNLEIHTENLESRQAQEAEQRAAEMERRRIKLEQMRCMISEENTPLRPPSLNDLDRVDAASSSMIDSTVPDVATGRHQNLSAHTSHDDNNYEDFVSVAMSSLSSECQDPRAECDKRPDIVKSTQTAMAATTPVAPPRRKKKNKPVTLSTSQDTGHSDAVVMRSKVAPPRPAPPPVLRLSTETSADDYVDGRHSLDINTATQGNRMVTADEDLSSRAQGKPDDADESSVVLDDNVDSMTDEKTSSETPTEISEDGNVPLMMQRPRSNSGSRFLSDKEILDQVMVVNLDTGEQIPLSLAEDKMPQGVNPLALHIMRRTKEYSSDSNLFKRHHTSDGEEETGDRSGVAVRTLRTVNLAKKKGVKIRKMIGKTVNRIKHVADEVLHGDDSASDDDEFTDGRRMIKIKAASIHKGPYDFDLLVPVQDLSGEHNGAVWTMKFSLCGRLLATGGQDNLLRVWVLKDACSYFNDMRHKYMYTDNSKVSPAPSEDSLNSQGDCTSNDGMTLNDRPAMDEDDEHAPFMKKPFCIYKGHTGDLLDISWSKNYFLLSSSMDKTVRLWHISRKECLCCFQHIDFVTAIAFHPRDDRYFLSGSLDGKLRLWSIPDKKVALWNEVSGRTRLITAVNFCMHGKFAVVGTYDGRCVFYSTEQLKYYTQIQVKSTRGRNARGRKITGLEPFPGEDKILVTSNDSRMRLYDLRDLTLSCKYKGSANNSSQIKASFSHNGKFIISGSEDQFFYIWRTQHNVPTARRDRNFFWEGIKAHLAVVTVAIFSPAPQLIIKQQFSVPGSSTGPSVVRGEALVSADYTGAIKVFINKFKPASD